MSNKARKCDIIAQTVQSIDGITDSLSVGHAVCCLTLEEWEDVNNLHYPRQAMYPPTQRERIRRVLRWLKYKEN